ncbi:hypothetical protein BIWAKO_06626 [Bosea sp. BIWAKO-01]|nr:hypothetical protein BIWAKO_06626 [Bosea sp. BIWAKO-01]
MSRVRCADDEGYLHTVIVWRLYPGIRGTSYTLDTGALVNYVDEQTFEIDHTAVLITKLS